MGNKKSKLRWISRANLITGLITGLIVGVIAVLGFIDSIVDKIKKDPIFMREVAKQVRP